MVFLLLSSFANDSPVRLLCCVCCSPCPAIAKERFQQPTPIHLDKQGDKWARASLKKMSLEQKIGQMFMIWAFARFTNFDGPDYIGLRDTMRKYHIGGFALTVSFDDGLLDKTPPLEAAMLTNQLQRDSEFPLLLRCRLRARAGLPPDRRYQLSSCHGLWRHARSQLRARVRPHHRAGGTRHRRAVELVSRCRREFRSRQSHHQHAFVRRRSSGGERDGRGQHRRRSRRRPAGDGQTFSRTR